MVHLYMIGKCRIETPYTTITPRAESLFALAMYLIIEGGKPISRRHLMTLFWPQRSEQSARHPLREALRKLRRKGFPLADGEDATYVRISKNGVHLDTEDLSALTLGEITAKDYIVLPGYDPAISSPYKDWVDDIRRRTEEQVVQHLLAALDTAKDSADWETVAYISAHILQFQPDNLYTKRVFEHATSILNAQTAHHVTRLPGFTHTQNKISSEVKEYSLGPTLSNTDREYTISHDTKLVGRIDDLTLLTSALKSAKRGRGSTIYLHGPPGIGKSRLVRELTNIAKADGIAVCYTACQPYDIHHPLSVFINLIPSIRELPGELGCTPGTSEYLDLLTRRDGREPMPNRETYEPGHVQEHIRQSLFDLVEAVAYEQPLVLVIENTQWSDPLSWALLRELTERVASEAILAVFTSRCEWSESDFGPLPPSIVLHEVMPLAIPAIAKHARNYLEVFNRKPDNTFIQWCVNAAEGNPYFIEELLHHWITTGEQFNLPTSLTALINTRLSRVCPTSLHVLQACVVLGKNSTVSRLRALLEYPEHTFLAAVDELGSAGMIILQPNVQDPAQNCILCKHDVLASAVIAKLSRPGIQLLQYRAGEILEREIDSLHSAALLWDCAEHWLAADNSTRAVELGLSCVAHLWSIGLPQNAIDAAKRTLMYCMEDANRLKVLRVYINMLYATKNWDNFFIALAGARRLASTSYPDEIIHDDWEILALDAAWHAIRNWAAVAECTLNCIVAPDANPSHKVRAGIIALKIATNSGDTERMNAIYQVLKPLEDEPSVERADKLMIEIIYHAICGDPEKCTEAITALLIYQRANKSRVEVLIAMLNCAAGFIRSGSKDAGLQLYSDAFHLGCELKAYVPAGQAIQQLVNINLDLGNMAAAQTWADKYLALERPKSELWEQRNFRLGLARLAMWNGELSTAEDLLLHNGSPLWQDPVSCFQASALATKLRLEIAKGSLPESLYPLVGTLETLHKSLYTMGAYDFEAYSLYLGLTYIGRTVEAARMLRDYVKYYRRDRVPVTPEIASELLRLSDTDITLTYE